MTTNEGVPNKRAKYRPSTVLVNWLNEDFGRAAHFVRVDPILHSVIISKLKAGVIPVTFEYACRLERAQLRTDNPFRAIDIMTYEQDVELYRYVTGQEKAPDVPQYVRTFGRRTKFTERAQA